MKLSNVILLVKDLDKSEKFYRDSLGLKESGRVEGEFVFFDAGNTTLAIRSTDRVPNPGTTEVSFEVDDVFAKYESLKSKVAFSSAPRAVTGNAIGDLYAADFRDLDGHIISITGWVAKRR